MHVLYIIQNKGNFKLYIGITNNIRKRLDEHNRGLNISTRSKSQWELVYLEVFRSKRDAVLREKRLKYHARAKQELYKRIQNSFLN